MNYSRIEELAHRKGYRVDADGCLKSPSRGTVKCTISPTGYRNFTIRIKGRNRQLRIHRLVAYQKYGEGIYEDGVVVRHLDGNRQNNSFDNIAIGTQSDNCMDVPREVRLRTAIYATSFMTKYDKEVVERIKEVKKTHGYKETMLEFGISSKGTLWNILNKR
nr:HNH endonuclease signature motif containing protein [Bacteroides acidifaciens]